MRDRIVAHRGNAAEFRENSLEAIRSAVSLGVRFVEFDVHLSRDGTPMVTHDVTTNRLFSVAGRVTDVDTETLRYLGMPTLQQAMTEIGSATAFVDLKPESIAKFGEVAVKNVMELARGHVLVSWDRAALLYAKYHHGATVGWIVSDLGDKTRKSAEVMDYLFCDQTLIQSPLWPAQWVAYEVASKEEADRLASLGVSYFETMNVRRMMND